MSGDREKLAREMADAYETDSRPPFYVCADIAIAYADRRVAEAIREAERIARDACLVPPDGGSPTTEEYETAKAAGDRIAAYARCALSPAREGGSCE